MMNRRHRNKETETEIVMEDVAESQDKELFTVNRTETLLKYIYERYEKGCDFLYDSVVYIINISGIYLLWIFLHYIASHLYINCCVPNTIYGFFMSPFMIPAPHCQGLRWIVYNGSNIITNMWIVLGTWLCSLLVINKNK
jgi:hypothetical protein